MNKQWLKAAAIRAVRTFAQNAAAMITLGVAFEEIDWRLILSVSGVAAIYSLLMAISGLPEVGDNGDQD